MKANGTPEPSSFPFVVRRRNATATVYREARIKGGREYINFRVAAYDAAGKRSFTNHADFADALSAAEARLDALGKGMVEVLTLAGPARLDYLAATERLPAGSRLTDAVDALLREMGRPKVAPLGVPEAVAAFKESRGRATRRGKPASADYVADLRNRLDKFAAAFPGDTLDALTGPRIESWIDATGQTGRNRFNTLRLVRTLLKWGQKRGHVPDGKLPTDALEITATVGNAPIAIFDPQELSRLLHAAKPEMVPFLALGAFAGMRTAEIQRLDWDAVKLERGFVEVAADRAKTAARRLVPVLPALAVWLAPVRKPSGPVLPYANVAKQIGWLARDAGVTWKHNALRHSFISYRLAEIADVARVALEAGNSPAMIFAHYRELVTPDQARAWFAVMPTAPSNVIPLEPTGAAPRPDADRKEGQA